MEAINSLIPGTKYYYHLYFLNVIKKGKEIHDFTEEEAQLYLKFIQKYRKDSLCYEIYVQLRLLNPLAKLPKMGPSLSDSDIKKYIDVIELITEKYLKFQPDEIEGAFEELQ